MSETTDVGGPNSKPLIYLSFANDLTSPSRLLNNLSAEAANLLEILQGQKVAELCDVFLETSATADEIVRTLQVKREHITIFHYGGHAGKDKLLLETAEGRVAQADAGSFAAFLKSELPPRLQLVFLNGCSTRGQVDALLAAGVPTVIATARGIFDDVAVDFATIFYRGIASGASIRSAFVQAKNGVTFKMGNNKRDLYDESAAEDQLLDEQDFPWDLYRQEGPDLAAEWTLWGAADDPLFDVPKPPPGALPQSPYPVRREYVSSEAAVFFGRGYDVRRLYDWAMGKGATPILLLHGQTGVGKSSLLNAGLRPRLEQKQKLCYQPYLDSLGLTGSLLRTLDPNLTADSISSGDAPSVAMLWRAAERETNEFGLTIILDCTGLGRPPAQTESDLTADHASQTFAKVLQDTFADPARRPKGKLIIAFRTEASESIQSAMKTEGMVDLCTIFALDRLNRKAVMEIVRGPASFPLRDQYKLTVDDDLPAIIADDLDADPHSPIAPILQELLTRLWSRAIERNPETPRFDRTLYDEVRAKGLGLEELLTDTLNGLGEIAESGLALDLLAEHTSPIGASRKLPLAELEKRYRGREAEIRSLAQRCQDQYLLAEQREHDDGKHTHSLTHDLLGPVVRHQFGASERPGQRARRILENQAPNWEEDKTGDVLSEVDLKIVEDGVTGMRGWTHAEERLVEASRAARARRRRNRQIRTGIGIAAIVLIMAGLITSLVFSGMAKRAQSVAIEAKDEAIEAKDEAITERDRAQRAEAVAEDQRDRAQREARRAIAGQIAAAARSAENSDQKLLLASEAVRRTYPVDQYVTPQAEEILLDAMADAPPHLLSFPSHRHRERITSIAFSPDGMWIATASRDGYITLWETATGASRPLDGHTESVESVAFNQDSTRLVSASIDGTARIWDVYGKRRPVVLVGHRDPVKSAAFDNNGTRIITAGDDKTVRLWDAASGTEFEEARYGVSYKPKSAAFSPTDNDAVIITGCAEGDGTSCMTGSAEVWLITARQHGPSLTFPSGSGATTSAVFSPDGSLILTASEDHIARLWDRNGKPEEFTGYGDRVTPQAFPARPTSALTFVTSGCSAADVKPKRCVAKIWSVDRKTSREFETWDDLVTTAAFSPDGKMIAFGDNGGLAHLWNVETGEEVRALAGPNAIRWTAIGPTCAAESRSPADCQQIVFTVGADRTARVWDAVTGLELRILAGHPYTITAAALSNDGTRAVTAGCERMDKLDHCAASAARLWDTATGKLVGRIDDPAIEVKSVAFDLRGDTFLTAGCDRADENGHCEEGIVRVWDTAAQNHLRTFHAHAGAINAAAFHPDGQLIMTAGDDKWARLWRWRADQVQTECPWPKGLGCQFSTDQYVATAVAFGPEGTTIAIGDTGGHVHILDAQSGQRSHRLEPFASQYRINALSFSSDEQRIVVAGSQGEKGAAVMQDIKTEQVIGAPIPHQRKVYSAAFSSDGQQILTADWKGAHLWSVPNNESTHKLEGKDRLIALSSDGITYLTIDNNGTTRLWDTSSGAAVTLAQKLSSLTAAALCIGSAPGQRLAVTTESNGNIRLYDTFNGIPLGPAIIGDTDSVTLAFSPDCKLLASGSKDGTVHIWEVMAGVGLKRIDGDSGQKYLGPISAIAFSAEGSVMAVAAGPNTTVWNVADLPNGSPVASLTDSGEAITSVNLSGDGKSLITAGGNKTATVWDVSTQKKVRTLVHPTAVSLAMFSTPAASWPARDRPNSQWLALTGDALGTVRLWDVNADTIVRTLGSHNNKKVSKAAITANGATFVTADEGTVRFWYAHIDDAIELVKRRVMRDPPLLTSEERRQYGLN